MSKIFDLWNTVAGAFGPSGREDAVRETIAEIAGAYIDDVTTDALGNLICRKKGAKNGKKLLFAAHMDSIGVVATYIEDKGFIRFSQIGGLYVGDLLNIQVKFANGTRGVISYEEKTPLKDLTLDNLFIDIGAKDAEEARKLVQIGDFAVYEAPRFEQNGVLCGPYLDNRIGCVTLLLMMEQLADKEIENDLYFVFTAQEEPEGTGEPISTYSGELELGGDKITLAALLTLIFLGIMSLQQALDNLAAGLLDVICPAGYELKQSTYDTQQEHEATIPQVSVGSNAGTIDTPSNNYNKGLDDALKDLGNRLLGTAGTATFGILLNKILSNIKKYTQRNTFNKKESHHVVPKKAGYDEPRLVLTWAGINRTTSLRHLTVNIAEIYLNLHYTIHHAPVVRDLYLDMLYLTYRNYYNRLGTTCDPMSKSDITNKTRIIRDFLETISNETHDIMRRYYV